ncbi:MAG: hypothetical protein WCH86_07340, partial [Kiritimatiellales bacterium]
CWRHKPRQPRVSANLCCGVVHSRAEPDENPSSDTRKGFLWAQLFRSPATAVPCRLYLNAPPAEGTRCCGLASGSPAGHGFPSIGNRGFILFNNALQLCEADVFEYWNSHYGFFQCLEI